MARIRRPGEQVTTTRPTRRVPGRNNRGGGGGGGGGSGGRNPGLTNVQKNRRQTRNQAAAAVPPAGNTGDTGTPPDTSLTDTITSDANLDPAAYLQAQLGTMHGGLTPGTSYDNWLNNNYIPSQVGAFKQYQVNNNLPQANFDEWVKTYQTVADAQFQYAHRPDTQRELNPFEGGGSHWSWFD